MKKLYTLLTAIILTTSIFAQAPEKMSYQAVVRGVDNTLLTSQEVGMQISILQGAVDGTPVYEETQTPTTNINGLVSIEIGAGTVISGVFNAIDWSDGPYFIKTETDPTGGISYTITGTSQLMSVPYALHANTTDSLTGGETDPIFGASIAHGITALDTANWNDHTIDTNTQLDSTGVAALGYVAGPHTIDTDTDTQLDSTGVAALGYVAGAHTIDTDTDTQLDSTDIADLGFNPEFRSISGVVQNTSATASDDFVFGSTTLNNIPGTSDDSRLFFDKSKGAFRAGSANGTQWDVSNLGDHSTAMGNNTEATGSSATAMGFNTQATGAVSTAMGNNTEAIGSSATAMGFYTLASGLYSTAMGNDTEATGHNSTAMGQGTQAAGYASTAMGDNTEAAGGYSTAMGESTIASGSYSTAMGRGTTAPSYGEMAVGIYNTTYSPVSTSTFSSTDRVFTVGNGTFFTDKDAMVILKNGNIGIGTSTPDKAKLEINGAVSHDPGAYGYFQFGGATGVATGSASYSIYASDRIAATQFNAFSDARIKNVLGVSNTETDLAVLAQIEITNYQLKDTIAEGNKTIKKVIAQQVKEVFPEAVSSDLTRCVPTIYQLSELNEGWISLNTDLVIGDKVKLIFADNEELVEVLEVGTTGFRIATTQANGKVFVYGKEVSDFHTVDYEAIAMLNVSATQELLKRIEELELNNSALEVENANQNSRMSSMEASLSEIKEMLNVEITGVE